MRVLPMTNLMPISRWPPWSKRVSYDQVVKTRSFKRRMSRLSGDYNIDLVYNSYMFFAMTKTYRVSTTWYD